MTFQKFEKKRIKKAIYPHEGQNIRLLMFSINSITKEQLNNLQIHLKMKRVNIPAELTKKLFSDKTLQDKFREYSQSYREVKGEQIVKTGLHEQFGFPDDVLDSIEVQKFNYGFNDRSKYVRALISFFYTIYLFPMEEFQKDIDIITTKMMEMGYQVYKSSVLEGKMHFVIEKPL